MKITHESIKFYEIKEYNINIENLSDQTRFRRKIELEIPHIYINRDADAALVWRQC